MNHPSISKIYYLEDQKLISVDQSSNNEDKTCLCFAKLVNGVIDIKEIRYIEKQKDIDKYVSKNINGVYKVFEANK